MSAEEAFCSVVGVVVVGVVFGTGIAVVPSVPVDVLKVYEGVVVSAAPVGAGVPIVVPGLSTVVSCVTEASEASEEAALESFDEYSDSKELATSELVAVATMLESSSLSEDAMLARTDGVVVVSSAVGVGADPLSVVSRPPTLLVRSETAEVMAPESDGAAVGRTPARPVSEVLVSLLLADSSVGRGIGRMPSV